MREGERERERESVCVGETFGEREYELIDTLTYLMTDFLDYLGHPNRKYG
jgi:hypothetical protein